MQAKGGDIMKKRIPQNDGITLDDRNKNQFTAYLTASLHHRKARYLRDKQRKDQNEIHWNFDEYFCDPNDSFVDDTYEKLIRTEPKDWADLLNQINNEKLQSYLMQLSDLEGSILFMRLYERLEYDEIDKRLNFPPQTSQIRKATILRKIRRWIKGGL